jgi:hypothetical protein
MRGIIRLRPDLARAGPLLRSPTDDQDRREILKTENREISNLEIEIAVPTIFTI